MDIDDLTSVGIILFTLFAATFFAASETAMTASSRVRLHLMQKRGVKGVAKVRELQGKLEKVINAMLVGNTLAMVIYSSVSAGLFIQFFGEAGIALASFVMGTIILVCSEILPKTLALNQPEKIAVFLAPVLDVVVKILTPVTKVTHAIAKGLLRIFGIRPERVHTVSFEDEVRGAIDLHVGSGVQYEREMVRSILDLANVDVEEIMIHRTDVVMVNIEEPLQSIVTRVLNSPYSRIPLWEENTENIVGILYTRDLLRSLREAGDDLSRVNIRRIMHKPWFIPDSTPLLHQLQEFRRRREHLAIVVDEYGTLEGIVTLEDILEEIVGEITDEHDILVSGVWQQADGSYLVEGIVTIRDLNRRFGWDLPDDDAATIAGLVLYRARKIPKEGDTIKVGHFDVEVVRRLKQQITMLRIRPPALEEPSDVENTQL